MLSRKRWKGKQKASRHGWETCTSYVPDLKEPPPGAGRL